MRRVLTIGGNSSCDPRRCACLVVGLVLACNQRHDGWQEPGRYEPPLEVAVRAEGRAPLAALTAFDCASSVPEKQGEQLRGMALGGPGGAAWNWDAGALLCTVRIALRCRATPAVTMAVGSHEQRAELDEAPDGRLLTAHTSFAPQIWRAALRTSTEAYATLRLRSRVTGTCASGDPSQGPPFDVSDEFTARFASGE
jgi:hypothetical protein